ncbi:MSCRAMM family adhesin SdrC, partial [Staphylococcus felis]|uniref:MSCRAMM family adhesin SdrC n=1 Tax=Staphylococcus felis TaxID=46127 RepID=UPI000E38D1A3
MRTTTDEKGYYEFSGLTNGNYEVEFVNPEGYEETPVRKGQDEGKDSNERGVKVTINNADKTTIEKGYDKPTYKLGDYVWEDVDKDGLQGTNENEKPIQGVEVIPRGENGQEIARTKTDENGYYEFSRFTNGNYEGEIVNPEGYEETQLSKGQD